MSLGVTFDIMPPIPLGAQKAELETWIREFPNGQLAESYNPDNRYATKNYSGVIETANMLVSQIDGLKYTMDRLVQAALREKEGMACWAPMKAKVEESRSEIVRARNGVLSLYTQEEEFLGGVQSALLVFLESVWAHTAVGVGIIPSR